MGRIGDDHRRSGHRLEHAFARAVEPDRAEARLEQTVPFGLLDLLLDLLTAHPLSAQPMEARPDNVRRSDDERRRHAGRDQADGEIEDPLGQAAHVVEHRIDEHDALPVQHDGDDADDGGELDHALEEFRQAAKPVDSGKPAANGKTGKIGHDPVDHEARRVLSGGGDDSGDNEQSENRRQKHQRVEQHQISEGELGGRLEEKRPIAATSNPLNPTYAYVITPPAVAPARSGGVWACPATRLPMTPSGDCYWSEASLLAYPVIGGIPVLREEAAVYATGFVGTFE